MNNFNANSGLRWNEYSAYNNNIHKYERNLTSGAEKNSFKSCNSSDLRPLTSSHALNSNFSHKIYSKDFGFDSVYKKNMGQISEKFCASKDSYSAPYSSINYNANGDSDVVVQKRQRHVYKYPVNSQSDSPSRGHIRNTEEYRKALQVMAELMEDVDLNDEVLNNLQHRFNLNN